MSSDTFPKRLTEIDALTRPDHCYLGETDECLFFGEYTARAGFDAGATNNMIHNFKKSMDRRDKPEWKWKQRSISEAAEAFSSALNPEYVAETTLIPMPPSKAKGDAGYDDRLVQLLKQLKFTVKPDIRELLVQQKTRQMGAHDGQRLGPNELAKLYSIDEKLAKPTPLRIALFDDLLVTGASFVAAKRVLQARFPKAEVTGFFLARRALPDPAKFFLLNDDC